MARLSNAALASVIKNYKEINRPRNKSEFEWYANQSSLEAAVRAAAIGPSVSGRRSRQTRTGTEEALNEVRDRLVVSLGAIESAKTFDALLEVVERVMFTIPGMNDAHAYEASMRIGAFLNIWPKHIYLFTSTRTGAKQIGIVSKKRLLLFNSLPQALQELEPYEAEEALSNLKKLNSEPAAPTSYFGRGLE